MDAVLFERDGELARLIRLVDLAASRAGAISLISGEPGSGKSSLVGAMEAAGIQRDVRVVVDPTVATIDELRSSVDERPLVVVVEDLHLADETMRSTLAGLAPRIRHLACGLVVTTRSGPPASATERCVADFIAAGADRVELGPLSAEAVDRLVAQDAGGRPGPRLRARLAGAAGNPVLVREFVRVATNVGALVVDGDRVEFADAAGAMRFDLPPRVAAWLASLSPAANEILRSVAVLGPCTVDWLDRLLGCSPGVVSTGVGEATAAGFLDPASPMVRFRHELLAEALRSQVPAASQTAMHRQLGRQLAAAGAPSPVVARHLELGSPAPDAETIRWMCRPELRPCAPRIGAP
jgi:energy-coupling factor transporter ATP-binding protein EcfA2